MKIEIETKNHIMMQLKNKNPHDKPAPADHCLKIRFSFCLPLAKSERTWLRPEELSLEANTSLPLHKYSYSKRTKPANKDILPIYIYI